ncbi:MAG TPA: Holliday junction DNA helicase RuvB C-terminal domain-containing protein, partial [Anaeromyxobacteraceae bacterium]|nr:Holliday junction DNA helicase RuvB C-terminal domain-containing protein [Anaeromyxobacteraceae bacterium]
GRLDRRIVEVTLSRLEVDEGGLDAMDRRVLACVLDTFGGGPVGLESVAAAVGEEAQTLEDVYEPFLIREGYLARTPRGRVALPLSYERMGRARPGGRQGGLL